MPSDGEVVGDVGVHLTGDAAEVGLHDRDPLALAVVEDVGVGEQPAVGALRRRPGLRVELGVGTDLVADAGRTAAEQVGRALLHVVLRVDAVAARLRRHRLGAVARGVGPLRRRDRRRDVAGRGAGAEHAGATGRGDGHGRYDGGGGGGTQSPTGGWAAPARAAPLVRRRVAGSGRPQQGEPETVRADSSRRAGRLGTRARPRVGGGKERRGG